MPIENVHCRIGYPVEHSLSFPESLVRVPDRVGLQDRVNPFLTSSSENRCGLKMCIVPYYSVTCLQSRAQSKFFRIMTGLEDKGYSLDLLRKQKLCI